MCGTPWIFTSHAGKMQAADFSIFSKTTELSTTKQPGTWCQARDLCSTTPWHFARPPPPFTENSFLNSRVYSSRCYQAGVEPWKGPFLCLFLKFAPAIPPPAMQNRLRRHSVWSREGRRSSRHHTRAPRPRTAGARGRPEPGATRRTRSLPSCAWRPFSESPALVSASSHGLCLAVGRDREFRSAFASAKWHSH